MLIPVSDKIKFEPMVKVVSVRILHCKLTIFFFLLNVKYVGEEDVRLCKSFVST